jgi:hypothetical protein
MEALDPKDLKRVERALDILLALFEQSGERETAIKPVEIK